ncbi:MAG6790 family protein [Candidatus Mycoplasma mahonii]|uniref:MAG6790 family protein n=1 Tax=Candidatus Mycoplasma mahonii TaxID=3004105 RepID=UPI0026EBC477|nr:hypothetical protein [Candidatus Mycoplasma mahonii]WKX02369.1 hypothetical protein O3I44_03155 [Candidatus Mycoplasma mahonii]
MYQYKAMLRRNKEVIAEGHTVEGIEKQVLHYKRGQKKGEHTNMNNEIEIIHIKRDQLHGNPKETLIKVV